MLVLAMPTLGGLATTAGALDALLACARKGRWKPAADLLQTIAKTTAPDPPPRAAFHAVLLACRKRDKLDVLFEHLELMGPALIDTLACNEALHAIRTRRDAYATALPLWQAMRASAASDDDAYAKAGSATGAHDVLSGAVATAAAAVAAAGDATSPDGHSYGHVLYMCEASGMWREALALLHEADQIDALSLQSKASIRHSALKACARESRWKEAAAICTATSSDTFAANPALARFALLVCSRAGDAALARSLVGTHLRERARVGDYARWLSAERNAGSPEQSSHLRAAWSLLRASPQAPDEQCYAHMCAGLLESLAIASEAASGTSPSAEAEALELAREAVQALSREQASVVLMAALGCAVNGELPAAASELVRLLESVDSPPGAAARLRIASLCARSEDYALMEVVLRGGTDGDAVLGLSERNEASRLAAEVEAAVGTGGNAAARAAAEALRAFQEAIRQSAEADDAPAFRNRGGASGARRLVARQYTRTLALPADPSPLHVLYEDEDVLVVRKPAGLSATPRHRFEAKSMVNRAVHHLDGRPPYVAHRLDYGTSGVLIFGKTLSAARSLSHQFASRSLSKTYLAVLCGLPADDSFEVNAAIARHPDKPISVAADDGADGAQEAHTRFTAVARACGGAATLCEVRPLHGRMHQIRLHSDVVGHPVAGDEQYGAAHQPATPPERLLLHAHVLELDHPTSGRRLRFTASPPDDFLRSMTQLGFEVGGSAVTQEGAEWLDGASWQPLVSAAVSK